MFFLYCRLSGLICGQEHPEILEQQDRSSLCRPLKPVSRSPSPSIRSSSPHHSLDLRRPLPETSPNTLAPPPPVPNGPRSPAQLFYRPRTPPLTTSISISTNLREIDGTYPVDVPSIYDSSCDDTDVPIQPSAKALGKQRAIETESIDCMCYVTDSASIFLIHGTIAYPQYARESAYFDTGLSRQNSLTFDDLESEDHHEPPWHKPTHYVYDAAAERAAARMREEYDPQAVLVNGVH